MDIKSEIEIKEEPLESTENFRSSDHSFKQDSGLEESQEQIYFPTTDVKRELEIKDEPLDIQEECKEIDEHDVKETSELEENQAPINDEEHREIDGRLQMEKSFLSKLQTSLCHNQLVKQKYLKEQSCTNCNISFKSEEELKIHLMSHSKRKFKCAHCSYESRFKSDLRIHLLNHSNIKLFKCSECNYECNKKRNFKSHCLTHANFKLFKCSECNYESNYKVHLKDHMLNHAEQNLKTFCCSSCNISFESYEELKRHSKSHTKRKFRCIHCNYVCSYKWDLKIHVLDHSTSELFK